MFPWMSTASYTSVSSFAKHSYLATGFAGLKYTKISQNPQQNLFLLPILPNFSSSGLVLPIFCEKKQSGNGLNHFFSQTQQ